jgi:phosphotransferase system enzyme I (PtsI)
MELVGTGVSPGVAVGPALLVEREAVPVFRLLLPAADVEKELARFRAALEESRAQLQRIKDRLARELGGSHGYIFDAQLLMLEDPLLLDRTCALIREERASADWALRSVAEQLHGLFEEFSEGYLKERSSDLDDVVSRLQVNLAGAAGAPSLSRLPGPCVLVSPDLTPSEAAELEWGKVLGVATDAGSQTYHTAILARSLGIPAVVGLRDASRRIPPGALLVVDGSRGRVVVEPSSGALAAFRARQERERAEEERLRENWDQPALTPDGVRVNLLANAEFPDDAAAARLCGASGIGLFRSEYLLRRCRGWPGEEDQLEVYRRLLERMEPFPVTVRLWDVGAEDLLPGGPSSPNPALGERALRLLRREPEPFRTQLRALLRAAVHGRLRILLPFVSGPADLPDVRALLHEVRQALTRDGLPFREDVPLGAMLEIPSAALAADLIAAEVDFLTVGTNDLIQYVLAVDRVDPRVAARYQPLHPGVLRLLRDVADAAARRATPLSVCGEMAGDPLQALALVGLGVRELSMHPAAIPRVKSALREMPFARAQAAVLACLGLPTAEAVEQALRRELGSALTEAGAPEA